jgi:hypothetical protein
MESGNKKWTPSETKNLISEFEETPCLWNVFDKGYKNKDMKAAALEKIALSLGFSVVEIKRKLHNLRCQFTSELQKTVHKNLDKAQVTDITFSGRRSRGFLNTRNTADITPNVFSTMFLARLNL